MGKVPLAHEVVGLDDLVDVLPPDSNGDTHDHVLGTFSNLAVDSEQVRSLEGLETELWATNVYGQTHAQDSPFSTERRAHVVVLEISVVNNGTVEHVLVLHDGLVSLLGDHGRRSTILGVDYNGFPSATNSTNFLRLCCTSRFRLTPSVQIVHDGTKRLFGLLVQV